MEKQATKKVCVTGGAGYLGSSLVKKLLDNGYSVHATLRNLEDKTKVGLLKSLPGADSKLVLFQADIYNPDEFKHAIEGCEFVFHVATPQQTSATTQTSQEIIEAAVSGVRSIAESCIQSPSVKRLIYTASVMAASPVTVDYGKLNFKSDVNESCWTPLDITSSHGLEYMMTYTISKTLAEKEALSYNDNPNCKLEVVSLPCGLVGGETLLSYVPLSVQVMFSPLIGNSATFKGFQLMEEILGSVPMVHIEDVCDAHIFCIEKPSMRGRFLCAAASPTIREVATYFRQNYPQYNITEEFMGEEKKASSCDNSKLVKMGFEYKYNLKNILDDSVNCGRRLGAVFIK
ncbi:NAD-dependent epimerase/dehydratase [Corchorus olitorius]|uniref:NAD-dependent epimerase/dehydratase n=1 Tax=Corchorus olitorius TaxID=93759 RepID=A0A1R3K793_9ROSI|nr:NAD-dependent epimerase/dehydratase [Corchorus olitorius]